MLVHTYRSSETVKALPRVPGILPTRVTFFNLLSLIFEVSLTAKSDPTRPVRAILRRIEYLFGNRVDASLMLDVRACYDYTCPRNRHQHDYSGTHIGKEVFNMRVRICKGKWKSVYVCVCLCMRL